MGRASQPGRSGARRLELPHWVSHFAWLAALGWGLSCQPLDDNDLEGEPFPNLRAELPWARSNLGWVANAGSDTISVVDLDRFELISEVPVGRDPVDRDGPRSLVVDPARQVIHVLLTFPDTETGPHSIDFGSERPGYIQTLALRDLRPLREIRVGSAPFALALTPNQMNLVVVQSDPALALIGEDELSRRSTALVLDARLEDERTSEIREMPLCIAPRAFDFVSDSSIVAACVGDDAIVGLDLGSGELSRPIDVDPSAPQKPHALRKSPDGHSLAVAYQLSRQVVLFDAQALDAPTRSLTVGGVPSSVAWLSSDSLLVSLQDPDGAVLVDTQSLTLTTEHSFGTECEAPGDFALGPSGALYLVCSGDGFARGTLVALDRDTLAVQTSLELGVAPDRMVVTEP